jgi:hypothetical protein
MRESALPLLAAFGRMTSHQYVVFAAEQYLPTGTIQSPLTPQAWGMKEFFLCDPFRNLLLFGESTEESASLA